MQHPRQLHAADLQHLLLQDSLHVHKCVAKQASVKQTASGRRTTRKTTKREDFAHGAGLNASPLSEAQHQEETAGSPLP